MVENKTMDCSTQRLAVSDGLINPFRFFDLPYDLRSTILAMLLTTDQPIDLHAENHRSSRQRLNIFLTSSRMHIEAYQIYYGRHTFRILPIHGRFFGHRTVPLIARLPERYRASLTSLELHVGPGWNAPPRSWRIDNRLGLEEMINVRTLKVLAEVDPTQDIFKGFRLSDDFYTTFCQDLLRQIIHRMPKLRIVEFDAWNTVRLDGQLITTLIKEVGGAKLKTLISDRLRLSLIKGHDLSVEVD